MKGYDNANGDSRGILERFLPTIFRKSTDGTPTHNAILGAIKQSIETTRDELASMSYEVYFTKATGKFLDMYGKYIGLDRLELEDDDTYRGRLLSYVKTQRGTISAIVEGIQSELGKDVNVSIYETWRNIFILNKSNLNGLDYIMGKKYRYGVIEITLDTYVDNDVLKSIVNKYKAHGVLVYYKYSLGGTSNVWDLMVDNTENYFLDGDTVIGDKQQVYFKNMKTYLADSPTTVSDLALFKTNTSDLNGSDILSGNPSNAYLYDKTKSPYFHLIGYVSDNVSVDSYPDVYDYVYKNNVVIPGGRNLFLNSRMLPNGYGTNGSVTVTVEPFDSTTNMWHIVSPQNNGTGVGIYLWGYADNKIATNSYWSYSADIKGTGRAVNFGIELGQKNPVSGSIGSDWSRISQTGYIDTNPKHVVMYFDTTNTPLDVYIKLTKLEVGNTPTDWTPAPEDNDHSMDVYRFGTEPYITLSKEDTNTYTFAPDAGSSPVFAFNMSRILANNGYNDQVKNFSSNQVTEIGIHTKGSETGLPNTTVIVKGNTGTPVSGSFQDTNPNKLFNSEFTPDMSGWYDRGAPTTQMPEPAYGTPINGSNTYAPSPIPFSRLQSAPVAVTPGMVVSYSMVKTGTYWSYLNASDEKGNIINVPGTSNNEIAGSNAYGTGYTKIENITIPAGVNYLSLGVWNWNSGFTAISQPMLTFSSKVGEYTPGYYSQSDKDNKLRYALSNNSSGDYTYNLSTPSQVSAVSINDYYPYGRSKRVITASGAGTTVPLGIFDTQTTPTMTVPNYATLNKDTITRYVDSVYVNTDVPLSALRIYNFTTQRWESVPAGRFNVGNYLKDSISIPGSYLLIKSTVNTIKYLDIDVTLLNLGVTK